MSDIPAPDLGHHAKSEVGPITTPRGTPILFHVKRFGGTSPIAPSIPVVEVSSHAPPRPSVSNPIQIPGPRKVNIGNTTYIPSHVPLSSNPIPFHVERFRSTSHITPSIPMVEASSHVCPRPSVSNPMWILELR